MDIIKRVPLYEVSSEFFERQRSDPALADWWMTRDLTALVDDALTLGDARVLADDAPAGVGHQWAAIVRRSIEMAEIDTPRDYDLVHLSTDDVIDLANVLDTVGALAESSEFMEQVADTLSCAVTMHGSVGAIVSNMGCIDDTGVTVDWCDPPGGDLKDPWGVIEEYLPGARADIYDVLRRIYAPILDAYPDLGVFYDHARVPNLDEAL